MSFSKIALLFTVVVVCTRSTSFANPQCADMLPPYKDSQVSYCSEYSEHGCCWRVTDRRAQKGVHDLLTSTKKGKEIDREVCEPYLRNVSCTSCSPYEAILFTEVSDRSEKRQFPQLCRSYCEEAYQACQSLLLRLFRLQPSHFGLNANPTSLDVVVNDSISFCSKAIPSESHYCYPKVLPTNGLGDLSCLCAQPVATGLRNPLFAVHSGDRTGRLFIGEQLGLVWVLNSSNDRLETPFLDIQSNVLTSNSSKDERGLLGMAFHPNYKMNGRFFVHYSTAINHKFYSRVSEFTVSEGDVNVADPDSERLILQLEQPASNNNGGQLLFKDGYLLVTFGDGGGIGDQFGSQGNAQNKANWLGSILRIDVDHYSSESPYSIPHDNPFVNEPGSMPEIYAYGFRNPWRCSVDRGDQYTKKGRRRREGKGRLFCADVGQDQYEEVNLIEKGGNYGWKAYEGNACFDSQLCSEVKVGNVVSPIDVYDHRSVGFAVTGGYVYRGCQFPNLQGAYIYGDFGNGKLFSLRKNKETGEWSRNELCMGDGEMCSGDLVGKSRKHFILSFGEDEDGELYILATSDINPTTGDGVVYRIIDPSRRARPINCKRSIRKLKYSTL